MKKINTLEYLVILLLTIAGVTTFFANDTNAKHTGSTECSTEIICGDNCTYGGVSYNTVVTGTQCWFKENLNVGAMITNLEIPVDPAPTFNDPSTVSKWCFSDSLNYCDNEGGLYTWAEANALPDYCNYNLCGVPIPNQGICPSGWHIPTDAEFYTLENYLTDAGQACDPARSGWGCSGAGYALILGGSSGFDAIGAGDHETTGQDSFFDKREPSAHLWSSTPFGPGYSYNRSLVFLYVPYEMVYRGWGLNNFGLSVRCLSDIPVVGPPTSADQCKNKGWKVFNNPTFKNQGDCLKFLK